jgi:outer membrane putative beta-barrel porin/alpha-amylase
VSGFPYHRDSLFSSATLNFLHPRTNQTTHRRGVLKRLRLEGLFLATLIACLAASNTAAAQWMGTQTGCYADSIAANPNRPTVSNPAHVTQYGVLELEYGWDRFWPEEGIHQTSSGGLLKFGMLCDIEFRWSTTSFLSQTDASGTHRTFGDNWLGTEIRIHRQTKRLPTMSFAYAFKIPSASTENGLGTGRVDHSFTFGASETVAHFNFDFNFTQSLIGRPTASGFDQNQQLALAFSHAIRGGLQFAGEFYGQTQLNQTTPAFASSLWALTYTVVPRLVIDAGFEAGLISGGPHRHAFFGATYSIANLYLALRRKRPRSTNNR